MSTNFAQYVTYYNVYNDKTKAYYRRPLNLTQTMRKIEILINVNKWLPIVNYSEVVLTDKEHNIKETFKFSRGFDSLYNAVWQYTNCVYAKRLAIAIEANSHRVKKTQNLVETFPMYQEIKDDIIELWDVINSYHEIYGYEKPFGVSLPIDPQIVEEIYRAFSLTEGMASPNGSVDKEYLVNNLPYLLHAYQEEEAWEYRIYVPFSGTPDARAIPHWHCHASLRFTQDEYDASEESDSVVCPRARRYA